MLFSSVPSTSLPFQLGSQSSSGQTKLPSTRVDGSFGLMSEVLPASCCTLCRLWSLELPDPHADSVTTAVSATTGGAAHPYLLCLTVWPSSCDDGICDNGR